jgi:hypothetical protein
MTVLDVVLAEMEPLWAMNEAAEQSLPLFSQLPSALDPVGSIPGSWRDRAIRAGRPSALLRREALDARAAAALHVAPSQPPQVGKLCLTGIVNVGPGMVSCVMVRRCEFLLC